MLLGTSQTRPDDNPPRDHDGSISLTGTSYLYIPSRPRLGHRLKELRGQSRECVFRKRLQAPQKVMHGPQKIHTKGVRARNSEELLGKRRQRPKGKRRGQIRLSGLNPDKCTNTTVGRDGGRLSSA
ncbi:uncharacterized protein LOC108033070 [Drosophila biarmipes]|uniref:uncharacterized protein LOC108033070 n=1 Tax=Drosophila biarmipes TaxID=125945 RepID=UPI001CDAB61C|nr:uncharacterized protein LOC108033070 [Drosophila biarmipes]